MRQIFLLLLVFAGAISGAKAASTISYHDSISLSATKLDFGSSTVGTGYTKTLRITHSGLMSDVRAAITHIFSSSLAFQVKDTQLSLAAAASYYDIVVDYTPIQNVSENAELYIDLGSKYGVFTVDLRGQGHIGDTLYDFTENLYDEKLKAALKKRFAPHTVLGYTKARDYMYGDVDQDSTGTGYIECAYTGRRAKINSRATAVTENFNCEHTFPQSKFSSKDPMVSDLWHMYSVDERANTQRSDNPFGIVTKATWDSGGSKFQSGLFEPRDRHKGRAARSLFYMAVIYQDFTGFVAPQEPILRKWHQSFAVLPTEQTRAKRVTKYQKNYNPFIDHPEFVSRIYSICSTGNRPAIYDFLADTSLLDLGTFLVHDSVKYSIPIVNRGTSTLRITQLNTSGNFRTKSLPDSITAGESGLIILQGNTGDTLGTHSEKVGLILESGSSTYAYPDAFRLSYTVSTTTGIAAQINQDLPQLSLYPNPVSDVLNIQLRQVAGSGNYIIRDMSGRLILSQIYQGNNLRVDVQALPKGMYFLEIINAQGNARKAFIR